MTDPTVIQPSSSSGGNSIPPTSPSRDSQSPPTYPSLSTSTSGTASPERMISPATSQQGGAALQQQPNLVQKPVSPVRVQAPPVTQMDSVVLGLQHLERQQAQQEQKRQATQQVFRPQTAPQPEDDDTVPSSTQNSNTTDPLDPGPGGSSIGRFISNTRVSQCLYYTFHLEPRLDTQCTHHFIKPYTF